MLQTRPPISAVIIDDEAGCVSNLQRYLQQYCPQIEVVAKGYSAADALALLQRRSFELAFLDIQLATDNSFDVLARFRSRLPEIVFVTAYESYALRAFEIGAADYLLKPIDRTSLMRVYNRLMERMRPQEVQPLHVPAAAPVAQPERKIILSQGDQVFIVSPADIYYVQAHAGYTTVHFRSKQLDRRIMTSKSISRMEQELAGPGFFRIHKSFLINAAHIASIKSEGGLAIVMQDRMRIQVAKRRSADFLTFLQECRA